MTDELRAYSDDWGPCDRTDADVCGCRFHRTMRAVAILRRTRPEATIALTDRKTGRTLWRILPDGTMASGEEAG